MAAYAELHALSAYSFLEGASRPEELVAEAARLGLAAVAITDRNTLAGVVRAHVAAKEAGVRLIIGARLDLADGMSLLAYPTDRAAYGRLCRLITKGRRRAEKGDCHLTLDDVRAFGAGQIFIALPPDEPDKEFSRKLAGLIKSFSNCVYIAASCRFDGRDAARLAELAGLAQRLDIPLVAVNDVLMHSSTRRPLADVLTCMRLGCTIDDAGTHVLKNAERHLKPAAAMSRLFTSHEDAVARTLEIMQRCTFSLDDISYEYPDEITNEGRTAQEELVHLTRQGERWRYPGGVPKKVRDQIRHELALIEELGFAPYFLTVQDIVTFARGKNILAQGRGSAANSAVCYCLGITAIDPAHMDLLFERFMSAERGEPPDIDVDFEHERREEVIQYIYQKYGRERAGMTAVVTHFRARGAIREVGKAMGLSEDIVSRLSAQVWSWSSNGIDVEKAREAGLDPDDNRLRLALELANELMGFPRHLSQHVGGFVITRGRLDEIVPVENARMEDRTVIEWDKNDLDALGILKVDVLGLGMLSCLRKGFDLIAEHYGRRFSLASIPQGDAAVYDMLCVADSIGVFQVESRAQTNFLPRMKPRNFYDLVIEVAIVRPGPIQGDMVHPYIRRRNGEEEVEYASPELEEVLGKTLGVPLFQEQAMKIAIIAAGFTPSEADGLRRAMATFRHTGTIHSFREKMVGGMTARGYDQDFAERCFRQIEGFGEYGFPESHAASFALLVYASAWMKKHYPDCFACAILNSQPMGFYAPAQLVRDAREHGVEVRPPDVNHSAWDYSLEPAEGGYWALRVGFRQIKGMSEHDAEWLTAARGNGYRAPRDIWLRAGLRPSALERLADADAFQSLDIKRREALWAVKGIGRGAAPLPLFTAMNEPEYGAEPDIILPAMTPGEEVYADYSTIRMSLKAHPMALLRSHVGNVTEHEKLAVVRNNARVAVCGLVLARQRPGTAKGVIFATLEDETGVANIIVWPQAFEKYRRIVITARLMRVTGKLQREGIVTHVIADHIEDLSYMLDELGSRSSPGRQHYAPRRRHPREEAKILFPSRDFH